MKWLNNKLDRQIFFSVFISMTFILTGILVVQLLFLDDWYYQQKTGKLIGNIENLAAEIEDLYEENRYSEQALYTLTDEFEEINSVGTTIIRGEDFIDEELPFVEYIVTLEGDMAQFYYVFFDGNYEIDEIIRKSLIQNNEVKVSGYLLDGLLYPIEWNGSELEIDSYFEEELTAFEEELQVIEGNFTIREVDYEGDLILDEFDALDYLIDPIVVSDTLVYEEFIDGYSQSISMVFYQTIYYGDGQVLYLVIETALRSVVEAMSLSLPLYMILYILAFILSAISAKVLARNISKPIVDITNMTQEMCELNFEQKVTIERQDEIGLLGININALSNKLDEALGGLSKANEQLLVDLDKERLIEQQRRNFVSNVSHDLKTPIGIAKGYLEAVLDGIREDLHDDYLQVSIGELDRMNQIVLNMLELMKLDGQEDVLKMGMASLRPYFEELVVYFDLQLQQKDMTIILAEDIPDAMIDHRTFKMLLLNILSNGIKYGKENTSIEIDTRIEKDQVILYIENHVENPELIDLDQIWHKFYTADASRNRMTSGTGLGLSIVKSILDQYESKYKVYLHKDKFVFEMTLNL